MTLDKEVIESSPSYNNLPSDSGKSSRTRKPSTVFSTTSDENPKKKRFVFDLVSSWDDDDGDDDGNEAGDDDDDEAGDDAGDDAGDEADDGDDDEADDGAGDEADDGAGDDDGDDEEWTDDLGFTDIHTCIINKIMFMFSLS